MKQSDFSHILYPGSFDPITYGHINVIQRISPMFNKLIVLVASSLHKKYWFSLEERKEMAQEVLKDFPNVTVDSYEGLTMNYAKKHNLSLILRGVRSSRDFSYERDIAINNKRIHPKVETFLIFSETNKEVISTQILKEIAFHKGNLQDLIPPYIEEKIKEKIKEFKK